MTEQTRNVEGCLPRIAQRGSCGGEADAFRDLPRRRRDPSAGFHFCGTPLANKGGAVSYTSQDVHLSYDGVVETRTTVLIVDDHPSFRACARAILEADGFAVIGEAENGQGALSAIDTLTPDVVLLDVQLPDIDGFEVARRLQSVNGGVDIVLTSSRDRSDYGSLVPESPARGFEPKAQLSGRAIADLLG